MNSSQEIRDDIKARLGDISAKVNLALNGGPELEALKHRLTRLGRGGKLPHWYEQLHANGTLPNLDGKSLGSVLEMIFVAVLEEHFYSASPLVPFKINPARGIDIPTIGVKSPSENYCTSEPFFSAYERLIGNDNDAVILLTNYQETKKQPPLRIRIINQTYLTGSQIADKALCVLAKRYRDDILYDDIAKLKKVVRFLAFVNQSDWEAKALLRIMRGQLSDEAIDASIEAELRKFEIENQKRTREGKDLVPQVALENLLKIRGISPRLFGLIDAADEWVTSAHQDFGRYSSESEWSRFFKGNLDGVIGMSYALQWRYNFGPLFKPTNRTVQPK